MLYLLCYVGATLVALMLGIIQFVVRVLRAFAKAAWVTISAVTGFVLGTLYKAAKHPATWAALTGAGVAVMLVNPLVGGLMAVIGGILTFITKVNDDNDDNDDNPKVMLVNPLVGGLMAVIDGILTFITKWMTTILKFELVRVDNYYCTALLQQILCCFMTKGIKSFCFRYFDGDGLGLYYN